VVQFVADILDNSDDPNSKVCLFGHHKDVIAALEQALKKHNPKFNPVVITGETKEADRQRNIHLFQETNQSRIFIGSMFATGMGITLTACSTVVFAELDWTPAQVVQSEDRCHRIGSKNTVWVYHIVADGSIDSKIANILVDKQEVSKSILDFDASKMFDKILDRA
jgi:SWI/SNF-related matrix-associated actin-dependent regulator 1 of chromatin subfamily A